MFKLLITVLILSDTGSVASSIHHVPFENEAVCRRLARSFTTEFERETLGHRFSIRGKGSCEADFAVRSPPMAIAPREPDFADFLPPFLVR